VEAPRYPAPECAGDIDECPLRGGWLSYDADADAFLGYLGVIRVWNSNELQVRDAREIGRVAGVKGNRVRDGGCSYEGVEGPSGRFSSGTSKSGGHATKRSCRRSIKWQRIEIGFRLLQVRLPGGAIPVSRADQGTNGQLGKSNRAY